MAAETRIKLANIITRLPEEAVDSLYETACKMFENHPDDERPCCPFCGGKAIVMAISAVNRNTSVKTAGKLLSLQQIP